MSITKKARPRSASKREPKKIRMKFHLNILKRVISYFFSENPSTSRMSLVNLKKLLKIVDEESYSKEVGVEIQDSMFLIKFLLVQYLEDGLRGQDLIDRIDSEIPNSDNMINIIPLNEENMILELSDEDVHQVDKWISSVLSHAHTLEAVEEMKGFITRFDAADFEMYSHATEELSLMTQVISSKMSNARATLDSDKLDFDLSKESLMAAYDQTISERKNPAGRIRTGIKQLNLLLGGGYQAGRVYLHLGRTGGWKSGYLLAAATWGKQFNLELKPRDPTKIPTILYVSHENDQIETMERLYAIIVPDDEQKEIEDLTAEEIYDEFEKRGFAFDYESGEGEYTINEINVRFIYRPNKQWNTADLDMFIDELSTRGFEVRAVFHDYVKRIEPVNKVNDLRLDLAEVGNEFSTIAKRRQIPIISAMQLNREGIRQLNELAKRGEMAAATHITEDKIGESQVLLENVDFVGLGLIEIGQDDSGKTKKFFTFQRFKIRGRRVTHDEWFAHPFESSTSMRICCDEDTDSFYSYTDPSEFRNTYRNLESSEDDPDLENSPPRRGSSDSRINARTSRTKRLERKDTTPAAEPTKVVRSTDKVTVVDGLLEE